MYFAIYNERGIAYFLFPIVFVFPTPFSFEFLNAFSSLSMRAITPALGQFSFIFPLFLFSQLQF